MIQDMYSPLYKLGDVANYYLILNISIHAPDTKEDKEHGSHSRILETPSPPNVVETLETEFRSQRGRIMVSGEPPSALKSSFAHLTNLD